MERDPREGNRSEDFADRVAKDLREVWPSVFGVAGVFAVVSLIPLGLLLYRGESRYWLLAVPGYFVIACYAGPVIAVMRPLLGPGRRRWEFVAGWLISVPVAMVAKVVIAPDIALFSASGLAVVSITAAVSSLTYLGIFGDHKKVSTAPSPTGDQSVSE